MLLLEYDCIRSNCDSLKEIENDPYKYCPLCVSKRRDLTESFVLKMIDFLDPRIISRLKLSEDTLEKLLPKLDKKVLSLRELSEDFILRNIDSLLIQFLMINPYLSADFRIKITEDKLEDINWYLASSCLYSEEDQEVLLHYADYVIWDMVVVCRENFFSIEFLMKVIDLGYLDISDMSAEVIRQISIVKALGTKQTIISKDKCSICFEGENTQMIQLECHPTHCFHKECLKMCIMNNQVQCPICRKDIYIFE